MTAVSADESSEASPVMKRAHPAERVLHHRDERSRAAGNGTRSERAPKRAEERQEGHPEHPRSARIAKGRAASASHSGGFGA